MKTGIEDVRPTIPEGGFGAAETSGSSAGAQRRALTVLFITVFIDLVGFGIVIPLLPLYAESMGASPMAVTALVAVYSLMQFAFAPWWGQLSDRIGRRPVLLIGLFGSGISYLWFGFAATLTGLFAARILAGVMGANIGVAQAYVADVTRPEDRARGMGIIGAAFGLGFIFGPVIGGLLSGFGPGVPFFGAALLAAANGILALTWLPESRIGTRARAEGQGLLGERIALLRRLSRERVMGVLYAIFFLVTLAFAALEATLSLWAERQWLLGPSEIAYMFGYLGVVATVVQGTMVGPLVRRFEERRLAQIGAAAFAAGLLTLPFATSLPLLAIALALIAFGQGTAIPSVTALISTSAAAEERGRLLGLSQSLSALARVVGPVWGGFAFSRIGIGAPYLTGAGIAGIAFLLVVALPASIARNGGLSGR